MECVNGITYVLKKYSEELLLKRECTTTIQVQSYEENWEVLTTVGSHFG